MDAEGPEPKVLIADKGYDADRIRDDMEERGGVAVIPMRSGRKVQLAIDQHIYALRNRVERCFNKLKNSRRVATRYDKTADSYTGFLHIASIRLWINHFVNRT
jgi:transposase